MIVSSFGRYSSRTAHDHELRACVAGNEAPQGVRSRSTSHASPNARSRDPPGEGVSSSSASGRTFFMIMGSFDRITTETAHDHGVLSPEGRPEKVFGEIKTPG
jgi:hypothetical protein